MNWGKQETYDALKAAVLEQGSYDAVFAVVRRDVLPVLYRKCMSAEDAEDILQEVYISVLTRAVPYLKKSEGYTEQQRNAWLRRVVQSKIADFYRTYYRQQKMTEAAADADDGEAKTLNRLISLEAEEGTADIPDPDDRFLHVEETPELLYAYLEGLFSIRTTPDKLIAFVYNKIICTDYRGIITYKTSYIADRFNGMAIGLLARTVKPQLELSLHTQLPDKAVQPLLDKLGKPVTGYEDRTFETAPFTLTARQITDCSNWIMKKLEEVIQNVDAAYNA